VPLNDKYRDRQAALNQALHSITHALQLEEHTSVNVCRSSTPPTTDHNSMTHDPSHRLATLEEVMNGSPFDIIDSPWGHIERWQDRRPSCSTGKSWLHFRPPPVDFCSSRLAIGAASERARALAMPAGTRAGPMKTPKAMGSEKPGIVAVTVLLAVAITDTVPATVSCVRQSCCRTFGDGHLAREGAVEHPLHE
jgi:hypothetical protein